MPIPDFQSIMLPLLKLISDEKEYKMSHIYEILTEEFKLTQQEKEELLPSGNAFVFVNRIAWAKSYLKRANLIDSPVKGVTLISQQGLEVIKKNPKEINISFLKKIPEYSSQNDIKVSETDEIIKLTPEELLEDSYQKIRKALAQELLNKVIILSPAFFEKLVVELLVKMGYGGSIKDAGRAIGKSGDEGIDGTIKEDKLGLDIIYVQAKRWQKGNTVGRPEIHKFVGALAGQGAKKGVFITTSNFTKEAREYSPKNETKIVLIDGEELAQLMIDYNLGVALQQTFELKRIDNDYFGEE
jgi:restriction system protein